MITHSSLLTSVNSCTYSHLSPIDIVRSDKRGNFKAVALNAAFSVIMFQAFVLFTYTLLTFAVVKLDSGAQWENPILVKVRTFIKNEAAPFSYKIQPA